MSGKLIHGFLAIVMSMALAVAPGCGKQEKTDSGEKPKSMNEADASAAAVDAALEWLALIDKGEYNESHEKAATAFKRVINEEEWGQSMKAVREPLGKVISRKVKKTHYATSLPGAPDGQYVVIQFDTSFENKKTAVETVTPMLDEDGKWHVSGYYIK